METVYDILNSSEHRGTVREYIIDELRYDDKAKLKVFGEWIIDYGEWEDIKYFAPMTRKEVLIYMELDDMVDDILDGCSSEEFGESFDIDWAGLGESFGIL